MVKGPSVPVRTNVSPSLRIPLRNMTSIVVPSPAITFNYNVKKITKSPISCPNLRCPDPRCPVSCPDPRCPVNCPDPRCPFSCPASCPDPRCPVSCPASCPNPGVLLVVLIRYFHSYLQNHSFRFLAEHQFWSQYILAVGDKESNEVSHTISSVG